MKTKKVILDTNIWISFLITRNQTSIDEFIKQDKIQLVFLNEL